MRTFENLKGPFERALCCLGNGILTCIKATATTTPATGIRLSLNHFSPTFRQPSTKIFSAGFPFCGRKHILDHFKNSSRHITIVNTATVQTKNTPVWEKRTQILKTYIWDTCLIKSKGNPDTSYYGLVGYPGVDSTITTANFNGYSPMLAPPI